jgi:hypothetical protein
MSTLPEETALSDLEREFMENEPPGLFPSNQDSYWGQIRKIIGDKLQEVADLLALYYMNQSALTVNEDDMREWEEMLDIPIQPDANLEQRRKFVLSRLNYGEFTRTRRRVIVETFIIATFGFALSLTPEGLSLTGDGLSLYSGEFDLTGTYNIVEDVENFTYDVRILDTVDVDQIGLSRELTRYTPGGLLFTITMTPTP